MAGLLGDSLATFSDLSIPGLPALSPSVLPTLEVFGASDFPPLPIKSAVSPNGPDAGFLTQVVGLEAGSCFPQQPVLPSHPILDDSGSLCCSPLSSPANPIESKVTPKSTGSSLNTSNAPAKSWAKVVEVKGFRSFSSLKIFPPSIESDLDSPSPPPPEVVKQCAAFWGFTLVGFFPGKPPHFSAVNGIVRKIWAKFGMRHVAVNGNGIYFFQFDSEPQMVACLSRGPWAFKKSPIFLKRWSPGMRLDPESLMSVPEWISLSNVPLEFWTPMGLS